MNEATTPASAPALTAARKPLARNEKLIVNRNPKGEAFATISPEENIPMGFCGAYSGYVLRNFHGDKIATIDLQDQPFSDGLDGWTNEALMALVRDRLLGYQNGATPSSHNEIAIAALDVALKAMEDRVAERNAAGVRGTHESAEGKSAE